MVLKCMLNFMFFILVHIVSALYECLGFNGPMSAAREKISFAVTLMIGAWYLACVVAKSLGALLQAVLSVSSSFLDVVWLRCHRSCRSTFCCKWGYMSWQGLETLDPAGNWMKNISARGWKKENQIVKYIKVHVIERANEKCTSLQKPNLIRYL